jgi:hypothetical protein
VSAIEEMVLASYSDGRWRRGDLIAALTRREDEMADSLRLAAQRFGLYPEIVAEVLAEVGLGTPPSPEARQMIHDNFVNLMERLRREHEQGN